MAIEPSPTPDATLHNPAPHIPRGATARSPVPRVWAATVSIAFADSTVREAGA